MIFEQKMDNGCESFPAGIRVLAVDDDQTCLRVLETLLRRCKYHVTTTNQAVTALKMLRENQNSFDLVISDVQMPDMDGFKLLELVGLEMDLPVIMLSAHGNKEFVMKGITHGACDYLIKPVRIEELKNIWQHVIRKKKVDHKDQKLLDSQKEEPELNVSLNKKRKEQYEEDDENDDGRGDDPSTQKRHRVVWTADLHRKFVAAVNHLGVDRAVPKKILETMNVEKLTRENVASHLQKYRQYLKRISSEASQHANMVVAVERSDSSYLRSAYMNGFVNLHKLAGSNQFHNAAFGSFAPSSVLARLNSPAALSMSGLSSLSMLIPNHGQSLTSPIDSGTSIYAHLKPENHNGNILQGLPLRPDQPLHGENVKISFPNSKESLVFPSSNVSLAGRENVSNSTCYRFGAVEDAPRHIENGGATGNQCSVLENSLNPGTPSRLLDFDRCNGNWQNIAQSSQFQLNPYAFSDCFKQGVSTMGMGIPLPDTRTDLECQARPLNNNADDHQKQYAVHQQNLLYDSSISPCVSGLENHHSDQITMGYMKDEFSLVGLPNFVESVSMQHDGAEQQFAQGSYALANFETLEDFLPLTMEEQIKLSSKEDDFGHDKYTHSLYM